MVNLYTTPSCASCVKVKKWFKEHQIDFVEHNMFVKKLTRADIDLMVKNSENGFEDIISTKSNVFKQYNIDFDTIKYQDLVDIIIENPSILKRPIIIDDKRFQVGYNSDDIREFVPMELRKLIMCENCKVLENTCDYQRLLHKYLTEIKEKK
jgi:regulatory protein spx